MVAGEIRYPGRQGSGHYRADPHAGAGAPKYTWIVPLLSDPLWLHATRGDLNISALDKASTLNISVLRGTPQEDTLRQAGLTKLDLTTDDDLGAKMLKAGRVDAWFTRGMSRSYSYGKIGGDPKQLLRGAETATLPMYLAGSLRLFTGTRGETEQGF